MTANDKLPSNLTFDKILTVLRCESRSGQFSNIKIISRRRRKRLYFTPWSNTVAQAQQIYISQVVVYKKYIYITLSYCSSMFKCNKKSIVSPKDCKQDALALICLNNMAKLTVYLFDWLMENLIILIRLVKAIIILTKNHCNWCRCVKFLHWKIRLNLEQINLNISMIGRP